MRAQIRAIAFVLRLRGKGLGGGGDLLAPFVRELLDDPDELWMLQAGDKERPPVGALLMRTDLLPFDVGEAARAPLLEGFDVELELLREQSIYCSTELEQPVDGLLRSWQSWFARLRRSAGCRGGRAVTRRSSGTATITEQAVEVGTVADVLGVVELREPFDHARQQQRRQR